MSKVYPITSHEGPEGKQRFSSTFSLTSELDLGGWSTPVFSDLPSKRYPVSIAQKVGWKWNVPGRNRATHWPFTVTMSSYLLTHLLTPSCRILLEKLTDLQLVKKFPAFHGTRRFITALTSVRHLSLSWASPIQSIYTHPTPWRSILILSTHLRLGLPSGLLPSGFPTNTLHTPLSLPIRPTCTAHLILLYSVRN